MKNIVSTIIVFGLIFLIIVVGAYVFDKVNGFGLINKVDTSINNSIQTILDDNGTNDNNTLQTDNNTENLSVLNSLDNVSDNNTLSNNEVEDEVAPNDNSSAIIDNTDETKEINDNATGSEVNSIESNVIDNDTDVTM